MENYIVFDDLNSVKNQTDSKFISYFNDCSLLSTYFYPRLVAVLKGWTCFGLSYYLIARLLLPNSSDLSISDKNSSKSAFQLPTSSGFTQLQSFGSI